MHMIGEIIHAIGGKASHLISELLGSLRPRGKQNVAADISRQVVHLGISRVFWWWYQPRQNLQYSNWHWRISDAPRRGQYCDDSGATKSRIPQEADSPSRKKVSLYFARVSKRRV